jgi:penicillin-binding protein 2
MKGPRYIKHEEPGRRLSGLTIAALAGFFILLARLLYLQVIESDNLRSMSESNRLRFVPVAASRGAILDRNGRLLVSNTPSFSVAVIQQEVKDKEGLISDLARYLGADRTELMARWEKGKRRAQYYPIIMASGISRDQLEFLEENRLRLPGIDIEMKPVREYPNGELASHLLGYLAEISEQELQEETFRKYNPGDYIGKSGIERSWEQFLRGADGGRQLEVDARGRYLRTISESIPKTGNSIVLTIDLELQERAEHAFGDKAGAAVLLDVNSGEILAFVSAPGFNPALFTRRMPAEKWREYLDDKRHPLENKALKGQYPPGSTFKIITALAGLQAGMIDENATVNCTGSYTVGADTFRCWNRHGHGSVNLKQAMKESCDVYFYQLGERIGVDRIAATAREFGLGTPMGVGLENEKGGLVPTVEWKEKKHRKKWYRGETLSVSIGQGYLSTTPIQLASMIATVANEGIVYRPHLIKRIVDPDGKVLKEFNPEVLRQTDIPTELYRTVKEGLLAVVNERGGTGGMARLYDVSVAGKTGTSQVVKMRDRRGSIPYQYRDHALFVAFAPFEKPEVAVAVVVEHGEHGGSTAGPIAGLILRAYFDGKRENKQSPRAGSAGLENDEAVRAPEGKGPGDGRLKWE